MKITSCKAALLLVLPLILQFAQTEVGPRHNLSLRGIFLTTEGLLMWAYRAV